MKRSTRGTNCRLVRNNCVARGGGGLRVGAQVRLVGKVPGGVKEGRVPEVKGLGWGSSLAGSPLFGPRGGGGGGGET